MKPGQQMTEQVMTEPSLRKAESELEQARSRIAELEETNRSLQFQVERARHAEKQFHIAVEAAPNGMIMTNREGKIIMVNSAALRMFGYDKKGLIDQPIEILIPERYRDNHPSLRIGFADSPATRPMGAGRDLYGRQKNGTEFPIEIGLNPIKTIDGLFVLASIIDISERKRVEAEVKSTLKEKEVLLREIHHRVKNNLQVISSLLSIQSGYTKDKRALELFQESQDRVRSMALIHEQLYRSTRLGQIDFGEYVRKLASELYNTYSLNNERVLLEIDAKQVMIAFDTANCCGLILNELLSNCLKHAFPAGCEGTIWVTADFKESSVSDEGNGTKNGLRDIVFSVRDDGVGLPSGLNLDDTDTLGLQLVMTLVNQLQGKVIVERARGTSFTISFREVPYMERI